MKDCCKKFWIEPSYQTLVVKRVEINGEAMVFDGEFNFCPICGYEYEG